MDVYTSISTRKSVRAFRDRDVPENVISRLLEAARLAPSASNRQEWRFVVVRNPETRKRLARVASGQKFVGEAPVVIACCAETDGHVMACGQPCYPIDVAIAIDHLAPLRNGRRVGHVLDWCVRRGTNQRDPRHSTTDSCCGTVACRLSTGSSAGGEISPSSRKDRKVRAVVTTRGELLP